MENKNIRFDRTLNIPFNKALKQKVDQYFADKKCSKKANSAMIIKMIVIFALFFLSYLALLSNTLSEAGMVYCTMLFGFSMLLIAFNIAHDASHDALFKSTKLNYLYSYTFNLIGVNRYIWNIKHNLSHHAFTNIPGYDMDIEQIKIARLVNHQPVKWYYKYQHIYVPLLYPLSSLYMVFIKDFQMFATKRYGNSIHQQHPTKEYVILFATKLFYLLYALVIPLLVIDLPVWKILLGFVLMHLILGTFLAVILFPAHAVDDSPFPEANETGLVNNDWFVHQIETSTNFSVNSRLLFYLSGGLNIHIPHHIFPGICHIHYYGLSKIIKQISKDYGIKYRENTLFGALSSHLRLLKKMGTEN